jgi:UDP-N-acetylglucosamine:LPS N-acetylglucosamine transferase
MDLHLAIHDIPAEQARAYGARVVAVRPVVSGRRPAARRSDGDPLAGHRIEGRRALVVGGSLGIGELAQAADDVRATGLMTPVVLCGTNTVLRERLDRVPGVVSLGWRDDVPDLLATSSCVVQNAGGFTSLEALASGCPVVTYRPIPGHGRTNAASLERAGLVPWARSAEQLRAFLGAATEGPRVDRLPVGAPTVVDVLTGAGAASQAQGGSRAARRADCAGPAGDAAEGPDAA